MFFPSSSPECEYHRSRGFLHHSTIYLLWARYVLRGVVLPPDKNGHLPSRKYKAVRFRSKPLTAAIMRSPPVRVNNLAPLSTNPPVPEAYARELLPPSLNHPKATSGSTVLFCSVIFCFVYSLNIVSPKNEAFVCHEWF